MKSMLYFLLLQIFALVSASYNWATFSKLNHFTKRVTEGGIYTGGRLQNREIAYIAQAGFASILSVVNFTTTDTSFKNITGSWPSSDSEKTIVESYGLKYNYFASSLTVESVDYGSSLIASMPKPLFIHCHVIFFRLILLF